MIRRVVLVVASLALVGGDEAARLAPGPAELAASLSETQARVARSEAIGVALVRIQNAWGEHLATGGTPKGACDDPYARSLHARAVAFGPAWRDAAQAARAERDRLVEIAAAATIAPLVGADTAADIEAVVERVAAQESRYVEAVAWQRAYMVPPAGCDLALEPVPGLPNAAPLALGESYGTAVIALRGRLCPIDALADGTPIVTAGEACVTSAAACDCAAQPVLPGAVLAPGSDPVGAPP